jgi:hypothetical protein
MSAAHRKDLPDQYPPHQTCSRLFQEWNRRGVFQQIIRELAADLHERDGLDLREAFIDGSFVPAKKIAGAAGFPVAACLASASPHEVKLAAAALDNLFSTECQRNLSATKRMTATSSMKMHGVELIAPHPGQSQKLRMDGRLRRYNRRWKVERLFA